MKSIYKDFGCKKVKPTFPPKIQSFLNRMKWKNILEVPRRKKGMTSSGAYGQCHQNVNKLVNTMGGSALRGYWVCPNHGTLGTDCTIPVEDIKDIYFVYHSVWINPEGKASDVTLRNFDDPYDPCFIPLHQTSDATMPIWLDIVVKEDWLKEGLLVDNPDDWEEAGRIVSIAKFRKFSSLYHTHVRQDWTDKGKGFSKPSMTSKLSFDEFEKKYKDQREFGGFGKKTPSSITGAVRQVKPKSVDQ